MADTIESRARQRCHYTWTDEGSEIRFQDAISSATAIVNDLLGSEDINYETDYRSADLLLNCIVYVWNQVPDSEFKTNYQQEIIECRRRIQVAAYIAESEDEDEDDDDEEESS